MKKLFTLLSFVFCLNFVFAVDSLQQVTAAPANESIAPAVKEKAKTADQNQDEDDDEDFDDSDEEEMN